MTETIAKRIDAAAEGSSPNNRVVLSPFILLVIIPVSNNDIAGSSGCGKSYLLLQTVSYALANEWLVLYVPRGGRLFFLLLLSLFTKGTNSSQVCRLVHGVLL